MANEDWIDLGENDEACAACGGDGCAACGHRGLVSPAPFCKLTAEQRATITWLPFAVIALRGTGDDRWDRPENRWAPRGTRSETERRAARADVCAMAVAS